jgi:hypothetical protein
VFLVYGVLVSGWMVVLRWHQLYLVLELLHSPWEKFLTIQWYQD